MEKIEASVIINRPVEEVWKFVTDVEKMNEEPKYDPGLLETNVTSSGPLGVGSTAMSKRSNPRGVFTFRIAEFEPNRRFIVEFTSDNGRAAAVRGSKEGLVLEPMDGKTKLDSVWDLKLNGFTRLVGPLLTRNMKKDAETLLGNIKRKMESEAKP